MKATKEQIKAELYKRSFYEFSLDAFEVLHNGNKLDDNWHIKLICDRLQVEAERITKGEKIYQVKEKIKNMIQFSWLNLSVNPYPMSGPLDIIFCRNVMIYFDNKVKERLLEDMYRLLKPGGYLMVGHAESLSGLLSGFRSVKPSVYIKK